MFKRAALDADEVATTVRLRLAVSVSEDGGHHLAQPCSRYQEGCCQVYASRPRCCVTFRCAVLERFEDGILPLHQAIGVIEKARRLADAIRLVTTAGPVTPLKQAFEAFMRDARDHGDSAEWRSQNAEFLLDVKSFELLLAQEFLPSKKED